MHFPNIFGHGTFSCGAFTWAVFWELLWGLADTGVSPLLSNHHPKLTDKETKAVQCAGFHFHVLREWLSVTSPCGHMIDKITSSLWLPTAPCRVWACQEHSLLPARSPKCLTPWWPGRLHEKTKSLYTQRCVLAFPSRGVSTNLETSDVLQARPPPQWGWEDAQWSWPLWTHSGLQRSQWTSELV